MLQGRERSKATYEELKKYVAEHNDGMKVSNLYIAQVKRKCGLELAENFNLLKSEDSRQPQCPKEKEEAINEAISYMESNLTEKISLADIADSAKISEYHFQRAFSVITVMTPTEYVCKRRLSQAGIDLSKGICQVLDVALKYGYDSPESFSKAFSRFHGITPTQAKNREKLKRFNRCTVRIAIEESKDMDYRIENWEAMNLILYTKEYNVEDSEQAIISLWKEYYEDEERRKVHSRIAVCRHSKKSGNRAEYGI